MMFQGTRDARINVVGGFKVPVFGELNERALLTVEVREVVNEMKAGKSPGLDRFLVECLKKGGMIVFEWLVKLLNECLIRE